MDYVKRKSLCRCTQTNNNAKIIIENAVFSPIIIIYFNKVTGKLWKCININKI